MPQPTDQPAAKDPVPLTHPWVRACRLSRPARVPRTEVFRRPCIFHPMVNVRDLSNTSVRHLGLTVPHLIPLVVDRALA